MEDRNSLLIKEKAPLILAEIQKANNVLLHCHPSPDPDSVGSALAMKFVLEQFGKKATVIQGDSELPLAFNHFPGAEEIIKKNFFEVDASQFDLFIILDSALSGVSRIREVILPDKLRVLNIDHHRTNVGCGNVNLVVSGISSCTEVLFRIFKEWNITLTPEIAMNLFVGMYTDSGGFKYEGTTADTFEIAAELARIAPDFPDFISKMENSNIPETLIFKGLAFSSIETFLNDRVAISTVSYNSLKEYNLLGHQLGLHDISSSLRSILGWNIAAALVEAEPGKIKISLRSQDTNKYDVAKLAAAFGGGGHKAAAGATLNMSLEEAKKTVVEKIKELYNL